MIKVLHLIKALGRGGAEVLLSEGLALADRQRFEFSYGYLQTKPDDMAEALRAQGARVDCFQLDGNLKMLLCARRVARHLREHDIDLVHAHLPMAGVVARMAGRMAGVPVVYTEHNVIESYHRYMRVLSRATWALQQRVVAISPDVEESIYRHMGRRVPVQIVFNGVNTDTFTPSSELGESARARLGIPPDVPVIGTVSVFRRQKRLDIWLKAARRILEYEPQTKFIIVGYGNQAPAVRQLADDLGLSEAIEFVGLQRDVRPFLAAMDVFLMSSEWEGFGLAPVEAMAMKIPVVATDVQGIRNVITHGETGLLATFDANVADNLAALVVRILRNADDREMFCRRGREAAVMRYSLQRMQRELESIYERTIHGPIVPTTAMAFEVDR